MLRIECTRSGGHDDAVVVIKVSGRLDAEHLAELQRVLDQDIAHRRQLDLAEVSLVEREVIGYLRRCLADGIALVSAPAYILEWIAAEEEQSS
jgi:hypothetical protein